MENKTTTATHLAIGMLIVYSVKRMAFKTLNVQATIHWVYPGHILVKEIQNEPPLDIAGP